MTYDKCRRRFLSVEVSGKKCHLKKLEEKHLDFLNNLQKSLSRYDFRYLTSFANSSNLKSLKRTETTQQRKLDRLTTEYLATGVDPDKVIFNYSKYSLSNIEKKVLSRGLRFSIYPNKLGYCSFLTPFEKLARSIKAMPLSNGSVNFDYIRSSIVFIL